MSGGSYDYAYSGVDRFVDALRERISEDRNDVSDEVTYLREVFVNHLVLVSDAMRAIEWVDSGDSVSGSEIEAVRDCILGVAKDVE